jgi:hypothetical protein
MPSAYTNALMISKRNETARSFWTSLIEDVRAYSASRTLSITSASSRHMEIMESTGPLALTRVARLFKYPITVLPAKLWNPYDLSLADLPEEQTNSDALVKILPGSSWHAVDSSIFSFLLVYKGPAILFACLIILLYVIRSELVVSKFNSIKRYISTIKQFRKSH